MININSKIFIAGHNGMLGSSILRIFKKKGYRKLITINKKKLDLRNQKSVEKFIKKKNQMQSLLQLQKLVELKLILVFLQILLVIIYTNSNEFNLFKSYS